MWIDPLELDRNYRLPGEEYGEGSARSVQNSNSELPESMMCILFRGSGSRGVQISDSELPESVVCIMFRGSGLGGVENSSFEHLRGPIYRKIQGMEAHSTVETNQRVSGPARAAGGRNFDFIRGLQNSAGGLSLGLTRLEPRQAGAADPSALTRKPPRCSCSSCRGWMGK